LRGPHTGSVVEWREASGATMAMREPVAMDFMGVGPAAAGSNGSRRSPEAAAVGELGRLLVRPIPNGGHARKSPEDGGGSTSTHVFASPGNNFHGDFTSLFPC